MTDRNPGKTIWRLAGECPNPFRVPESAYLSVLGLNPWKHAWIGTRETVIVPHPRGSSYLHLRISMIETGPGTYLTFAAEAFPDGSWAFFVPSSADEPGAFEARTPKFEGHWRVSFEDKTDLPWPVAQPAWHRKSEFLVALVQTEGRAERIVYRGLSLCRLCRCVNGNAAFRLDLWEWPDGFKHYISDHDVRPSKDFESFILRDS